jgi:hypothetical protein
MKSFHSRNNGKDAYLACFNHIRRNKTGTPSDARYNGGSTDPHDRDDKRNANNNDINTSIIMHVMVFDLVWKR